MNCAIYYPLENVSEKHFPTYKEQKKLMTDFVKSKGWKVAKEYREQSKREPSIKFEEMKKDSYSRQFDYLLVYSVHAFGRHPLSSITLLQKVFLPAGIGFCIFEESYDSSLYSSEENEKFLDEKARKFVFGYRMDGLKKHRLNRNYNQYGYLFVDTDTGKKLIVDESVSEYVKAIFEQFSKGVTRANITKYLNDNKVVPPTQHFVDLGLTSRKVKSKKWSLNMVSNILSKEIYFGTYRQNFMDESVDIDAPVFIDKAVLEKVKAILKEEEENPYRFPGNNGPTALTGLLYDKKTGNRINSYDRSLTDNFCLRAVIGEKTTSRIYSEEKIFYKDAIKEAQRVMLAEHRMACNAKKFLSSAKGEKFVSQYFETLQNERRNLLQEVIILNHLDTIRRIEQKEDTDHLTDKIDSLDEKILDVEEQIKKLKVALTEKNPWIVLFTRQEFKEDLAALNIKKYAERIACIDFEKFELIPKNNDWKELIPEEWRGEKVWQEKVEKMQNV